MSPTIRQQADDLVQTARRAGIMSDDPLALVLTKLASLAETVSASGTTRQEDLERAMLRAGLTVARQLAVRVERRTAMAIGAACVLIAVLSGGIGKALRKAMVKHQGWTGAVDFIMDSDASIVPVWHVTLPFCFALRGTSGRDVTRRLSRLSRRRSTSSLCLLGRCRL